MASIRREVSLDVPAEQVWDALRDVGALHTRLVKGFVTDCRIDGDSRIVTFANGVVVRERIVDLDERARRLVWSAVGGQLTHHNASAQVIGDGPTRSRLVWIADLLPHDAAPAIAEMMEHGTAALKKTVEGAAVAS